MTIPFVTQIESLLAAGVGAWEQVCAVLDAATDADVRADPAELERVVAVLPPRQRPAPERWVARLRRDGHEPRLRACGSVAMVGASPTVDELERVLVAEDIRGIESLDLSKNGLDATTTSQVAGWLAASAVTELVISNNPVAGALAALLGPSGPAHLDRLVAVQCSIGDEHLDALARQGIRVPLRELEIGFNLFHQAGASRLAQAPGLESLHVLDMWVDKILGAGVAALASSDGVRNLRRWNLSHSQCGDDGAVAISASPHLDHLEHLTLTSAHVANEGAIALASSPALGALTVLDLNDNHIEADGARALIEPSTLVALRSLRLDGNPIGDEGAYAIARCPGAARLSSLFIEDDEISEEARKALRESPYLRDVRLVIT